MAPQEGAFAWLDGLSIPIGAKNFDETYTFLNYIYDSEVNGLIANETGYNPVSIGAENYLSADSKKAFGEAYPGDALDRLWWWPPSHPWYTEIRAEYSDKYRSEEHTSELQSLMRNSYDVFCLKKKNKRKMRNKVTHDKKRKKT